MSYVVIEPFNIKIRRAISKVLKRSDQKVEEFDQKVKEAFEASHPWLKTPKNE